MQVPYQDNATRGGLNFKAPPLVPGNNYSYITESFRGVGEERRAVN
jgi:hypothetical protein